MSNSIKLFGIIETDLINYKKISMVLEFPKCSFKCNKEFGSNICQNSELISLLPDVFDIDDILDYYVDNPMSEAVVCQGLEPFDSFYDLHLFIKSFRKICDDDIVIYSGYYENEIPQYIDVLKEYKNIVIKFGRFIPDCEPHFDEELGVNLLSDNQYSVRIS